MRNNLVHSVEKLFFRLSLVIVLTTTVQAAQAQLLAYEGFDYAEGDLIEVAGGALGGGLGWESGDLNPAQEGWYFEFAGNTPPSGIDVEAAPVGWGYTDSQGNQLVASGGVANNTAGSSITRQIDLTGVDSELTLDPEGEFGFHHLGVGGTSFWISFLGQGTEIHSSATLSLGGTNPTALTGFDRAVALGRPWMLHEDGSQGQPVGSPPSVPLEERNRAWGILDFQPTIDPLAATGDLYNEKVFFVARVDFHGGNETSEPADDEKITIWTNPDLGSTAPSDASAAINDFGAYSFDFNAIRLGGPADTFFDEIRIGLTYGDVAPIAGSTGGADFDADDDVDGADFLKWQREFGTTYDATDLANWVSEFGPGTLAALSAVPEPSTALLLSLAVASLSLRRRRLLRSRQDTCCR